MRILLNLLIICIVLNVEAQSVTGDEYIKIYHELAVKEMNRVGIPASIILAQGMLESGNGNSSLAVKANNHFGIKCHNWNGATIYHDDDKRNECFRKYRSADESYIDHSDFLANTSRYAFLFEYGPTDYKAWARGLKKAGYATAHDYDKKLIDLIERYELHQYDTEDNSWKIKEDTHVAVVHDNSKHMVKTLNNIKYVTALEGDSYQSLIKELGMYRWQIARYNEFSQDTRIKPGDIIYLQPKRKKAEVGKKYHIVKEGETMYTISQLYGIKKSELFRKNLMLESTEPKVGDQLNLRKRKKGKMPEEPLIPVQQQLEFIFE